MNLTDRLSKNYTAAGGRNASALPWATIIQFIMSLFGGCTPAKAKRWSRLFPEATKHLIDGKLKDEAELSASDRKAVVEGAYKTFIGASDAEIQSVMP